MTMPMTPSTLIGQPSLPDLSVLTVPTGQVSYRKARAKGIQIYPCNADQTFGQAHPEAILVTYQWEIIHHYKGPNWEAADGSFVVGTVIQKASAPDPDAIPWLLLSTKPGGTENGLLSKVSFIQRVYSRFGNAPAGGCNPDGSTETPVFYEAEYYFYVPDY
jgi:hypothetical protein